MKLETIWHDKPSIILLIPDCIKVLVMGILLLLVYLIGATDNLDNFMNSHFALSIIGDLITYGGKYLFMAFALFYFASILLLVSKVIRISFEKYTLDEQCFHFENGVFSVTQDETQLFRMIDFEVQKPFLLRIFGCGNVVIFSNDPSLDSGLFTKSFITADGNKGMILAGIKDPEQVKAVFKAQVDKVRLERGTRTTELI